MLFLGECLFGNKQIVVQKLTSILGLLIEPHNYLTQFDYNSIGNDIITFC